MSFGFGLGAFTDGLMKGRNAMQQLKAQGAANTDAANGTAQPAKPQMLSAPNFGEGSNTGLGALVNGIAQGRNSATQAAAAKSAAMGAPQQTGAQAGGQSGGLWTALASALGMQTNAPASATTGMTEAAGGTAAAQEKSIIGPLG